MITRATVVRMFIRASGRPIQPYGPIVGRQRSIFSTEAEQRRHIPAENGAQADFSLIISGIEYQRSGTNAVACV